MGTNYTVNSAFISLNGTDAENDFTLNTSLEVSINGLAGNDTISGNISTFKRASILGGDGDDVVAFSSLLITASKGVVNLGTGSDRFSGMIANAPEMSILGYDGNDTIGINGSLSGFLQSSRILGGQGLDQLNISLKTANNFIIAGGGDSDSITFSSFAESLASGTVAGGGGSDVISGYFHSLAVSGFVVAGDNPLTSEAGYDGNDTLLISAANNMASSTINGQGGRDLISIDYIGTSNLINGNSGNDTLEFRLANSLQSGIATTIGGGQGDDNIYLNFSSMVAGYASGLSVQGGGGNDSITIEADTAISAASRSVYGGEGSDLFDLTGNGITNASSGGLAIFSYANMRESTANATDFYSGIVNQMWFYVSGVSGSVAMSGQTSTGGNYIITGGIAYFTSTFSTDISARASIIDGLATGVGSVVLFGNGANGANNYLFVQGGADDLVLAFNAANATALEIVSATPSGTIYQSRFA